MKILSISSIVALAVFTVAPAWAICTPAQVNPGAVQRIRPYMSVPAALAAVGCLPVQNTTTASGTTLLRFALPLTPGGLIAVFDSRGAVGAVYTDPTITFYTGAFAPNWIPSAGALPALR